MQEPSALGRAVHLVRDLRTRCPWDGAQTEETLRPYLVEEALELDHALGTGDPRAIRDELGDLLLHLAFQIVLGEEKNRFGSEDVVSAMERKMWRRHPHLFPTQAGDAAEAAGAEAGEAAGSPNSHGSWERTKVLERGADGPGVLDGLPPNLPALIMAFRLQERAAGVGFDWPDAASRTGAGESAVRHTVSRDGEAGGGARDSNRVRRLGRAGPAVGGDEDDRSLAPQSRRTSLAARWIGTQDWDDGNTGTGWAYCRTGSRGCQRLSPTSR